MEAFFVESVLRGISALDLMHVARDGVEAMAFLKQEGEYSDVRLPDLILLCPCCKHAILRHPASIARFGEDDAA